MFKLLLLGLYDDADFSDSMWDKAEQIPGALIIQREIRKAASGENFFINDERTGKPVRLQGVSREAWIYYYKLWEDFHYFGLQSGAGSGSERRWYLEFIKTFEKSYKDAVAYIEAREMKKIHGKH